MSTVIKDWIRLDNAATIYPASTRRDWAALFRLSATLNEEIDRIALDRALDAALRRYVSFSYKLRRGAFWYYLERSSTAPAVQDDVMNPCVPFKPKENGGFCFRIRVYGRRIAVEIFHALTDGYGGLVFLNTLVAEYLRERYGADIPRGGLLLDCTQPPDSRELEDGYVENARDYTLSRSEPDSFRIRGRNETDDMVNITTGVIPADELIARARAMDASATEYLTAVLLLSADKLQRERVNKAFWKPVKINVPVNLRTLYETPTLRNFASYVNPGINPKLGEYTLEETVRLVHHFMRTEVNEKSLNAKFTTNVKTAQNPVLRVAPLFLKNFVMRAVFMAVGDKKTCTCFSNLGNVRLPDEMNKYIEREEFILGPLSINKIAVAMLGYGGEIYINFTRTITDPAFEREFFTRLVKEGVPVKIESNRR